MNDPDLKAICERFRQFIFRARAQLNLAEIQRKMDILCKIFISVFQIALIFVVGFYLIMLAEMVLSEQEGITILPFDTSGMGEDCSGKAVSDRLSMEILEIKEIREYKQNLINLSMNTTKKDIDGTPFMYPARAPLIMFGLNEAAEKNTQGTALKYAELTQSIFLKTQNMERSFSDLGNVAVGSASLSFGQMLWMLRSMAGRSDRSISGSVEFYGRNISIVAVMDEKGSKNGAKIWERTLQADNGTQSREEKVPSLVRDLAYNIFYDLQSNSQGGSLDNNWLSFEYLTEGWNAYRYYNLTGNTSYLDTAEEMMKRAFKEDPNSIESAQLMAILQSSYQEIGDFDRAMNLMDIATQMPILSADAWFNKGVLLSAEWAFSDANDAFNHAIKVDPNNKMYWVAKSYVLNKLGNENALVAADEALNLDPGYADAWHERGIALYQAGDYDNSSDAYKKAITLDGGLWWYYYDYAILLMTMGQSRDCNSCYNEAIKNLNIALELNLSYADRNDIYKLKEITTNESMSIPSNDTDGV